MTDQPNVPERNPSRKPGPRLRSMTGRERTALVAFGILLVAFGLLAMFVTENEAGTAIAVLLGGVSVLVGIQGTPLIELGVGENSVRLAQREILAEKAIEKAESNPGEARAMIDGFRLADPEARRDPLLAETLTTIRDAEEYERSLAGVLRQTAGSHVAVRFLGGTSVLAVLDGECSIAVEPIYVTGRTLGTREVGEALRRGWEADVDGLLVVTNATGITPDAQDVIRRASLQVEVVLWRPTDGPGSITAAIDALRGRVALKSN